MVFSTDLRWRGVVLIYVYNLDITTIATVLGVSERSLSRWYRQFRANVLGSKQGRRGSSWPPEVLQFVKEYVAKNPCVYLEELRHEVLPNFPSELALPVSDATLCRALRFDLGLTRKVLTKRATESVPRERLEYIRRLQPYYRGPDQLVFVNETSKDGRSVLRKYGWSARNIPAVAPMPFGRGKRVSLLAAIDVTGFFAWGHVEETFTRVKFHAVFKEQMLPFLNPWPLPRSIVIMDNARIHMYKELPDVIDRTGALLFFLPPYSPDLNLIEVGFSLFKRWIQRHASLAFRENPVYVTGVALYWCTKQHELVGENLYGHCGYRKEKLSIRVGMHEREQ